MELYCLFALYLISVFDAVKTNGKLVWSHLLKLFRSVVVTGNLLSPSLHKLGHRVYRVSMVRPI